MKRLAIAVLVLSFAAQAHAWPWHHKKPKTQPNYRVQRDLTRTALSECTAAFFLKNSSNPLDILPTILGAGYDQDSNIKVCVVLPDGRYGTLMWKVHVEKDRAWLEQHFDEKGIFSPRVEVTKK